MKIRCAWHPKYFSEELDMGTKEPLSNTGTTDGMCAECQKLFEKDVRKNEHIDDGGFHKDYVEAQHKDFVRQGRAWKMGVFEE